MKIQELKKEYDGKTVVDSVSFEIHKGKVTALIGPNGAGKSTVMSMISRLIAKDEGLIELEEKQGTVQTSCDSHTEQPYPDETDGERAGCLRTLSSYRRKTYPEGQGNHRPGYRLYGIKRI